MNAVTVLAVPDCPSLEVLLERLRLVLPDSTPAVVVVSSEAEAVERGMRGSPTLLIDGVDPFASSDASPSMSCRLAGAPTVEQLREVLGVLPYLAGREEQEPAQQRDEHGAGHDAEQ